MKPNILVTDFDGVVGNSLPTALKVASQITNLFDPTSQILSFHDYRRFLGKKSELPRVSSDDTSTLRELHRLLMRHWAEHITLFTDVLEVYRNLRVKPTIVSSAYARTVTLALGTASNQFATIYGRETSSKEWILSVIKKDYDFVYVTDTKADIIKCKRNCIPVIAVGWGYDQLDVLAKENPDFMVANSAELIETLKTLELIY